MAITKFTPPAVPNDAPSNLRAWLSDQMRRLQTLVNKSPQIDEDETITGDWTFEGQGIFTQSGSGSTSGIIISAPVPFITFDETDQSEGDERYWSLGVNSLDFRLIAYTDADVSGATPISVQRANSSTTIDEIELNATALDFNGTLDVSGNTVIGGTLSIPNGEIQSGTYTPTLTNSTNVADSTAFACQWMRVGSVVTVSGQVNIDPTASATQTVLLMSLPVAAVFSSNASCGGSAGSFSRAEIASIRGATATNEARFDWFPTSTDNTGFPFTFTYEI